MIYKSDIETAISIKNLTFLNKGIKRMKLYNLREFVGSILVSIETSPENLNTEKMKHDGVKGYLSLFGIAAVLHN